MRPKCPAQGALAALFISAGAAAEPGDPGGSANPPSPLTALQPEQTGAGQFCRGLADRTSWEDWFSGTGRRVPGRGPVLVGAAQLPRVMGWVKLCADSPMGADGGERVKNSRHDRLRNREKFSKSKIISDQKKSPACWFLVYQPFPRVSRNLGCVRCLASRAIFSKEEEMNSDSGSVLAPV